MSDDSDLSNNSRLNRFVDLENGHYSGASTDSDTTASDADDDEDNNAETGDFDTNLPTAHGYLGTLDNVGGYTLYDEGQIIPAMLAIHTNTLVFPGFTLPLVIRDVENQQLLDDIEKGYTFALICTDKNNAKLYEYGVVMEVFETSYKQGTINLKAKGRQRCQIVPGQELRPAWGRMHKLTVKILGEPNIKSPVSNTQLQTLKARRCNFDGSHESLIKNYKFRRYHLSQFPYASWVYDHNELSFYVSLITRGLTKCFMKENIPQDPLSLSYWFVQNFQLTHRERLEILKCNSVLERLRLELRYLKMKRKIICGKCYIEIANQNDVFVMSKDGVQSNYCNPGGQVYETVTVTHAKNFTLLGVPSKQFSWFPGYAWTILQCYTCQGHLGWQFTSKNHQPQKFFGLANSCLDIKIVSAESQDGV